MQQDLGVAYGPRCHPFGAQPATPSSCQHGITNAAELREELGVRTDKVKVALRALGDLPIPLEAQFRLGELYVELCRIVSGIDEATPAHLSDGQAQGCGG